MNNINKAHIVKIIETDYVTHDVKCFKVEKPVNYRFIQGQATDISINQPGWENELRPFTFTGLNQWDHLEFTIKIYDDHHGVTAQLGKLSKGDTVLLHDVFGAIHYYGEGTFIAGGAGITPFIAIFRQLELENKLGNNTIIFSNKTADDIILKNEFAQMLAHRFINTITNGSETLYDHRMIDKEYLAEKIKNYDQYFYLCGPDPMVEAIQRSLVELGVEKSDIIIEQF